MMSLPQSLPSLFGRFTAILKDHDHLGGTLRELKAACVALEEGQRDLPGDLSPGQLLQTLRMDLSQHFGAEESDDYFGTVVSEDPGLHVEIAALKAEHATMLRAVDVLVAVATDPTRWVHLPGPTRLLVAQLERHEISESKLLRSFFFSNG